MSAKRALITGITGMVGSHLAEYLLENTDWEIIGLLRWRSPLDNLSAIVGPINSRAPGPAGLRRPARHPLHPARRSNRRSRTTCSIWPPRAFPAPASTRLSTRWTPTSWGRCGCWTPCAPRRRDAVIHVCASSEVFGRVPKEKLPISEECSFHPASPYAISKVGTDLVGRFYAEAYGMTVMTTACSPIPGRAAATCSRSRPSPSRSR